MTEQRYLRSRWFEDIPVGEFHVFGSYTFSEQEIIDFGKLYAPQSYHTDPEAALNTRHRGLIASNWHVCAVWMRLMVSYMENYALGVEDGRRNGAGLGIEDLEVFTPVRPGHTLIYSHEIIEKTDKIIRDKWGVIRSRNEAVNNRGELVLRFYVDILAERDPAKL
ncbi:MaoC family dehydratase N-terminal domain-containing protein [Alphaproteobacteria bacterium]|nr:MaoC family dehydratase N-terminal domain-containing protein [Alphaproteobacteria bacterium]